MRLRERSAYNYVEPMVTEDVDILIALGADPQRARTGLVALGPMLSYLKDRGYSDFRKEGILIEAWAVQFIPVANGLDAEALAKAVDIDLEVPGEGSVRTRVLRAEHIVAIALRVGRARDRSRIIQFLEEEAVDIAALCDVVQRHDLGNAWAAFCRPIVPLGESRPRKARGALVK